GWRGEIRENVPGRAGEAERKPGEQRARARQVVPAPVRVRVATQPTFTRYVFQFSELTAVTSDNANDKLTLTFDGPFKFDLADAVAALPPMVNSIDSQLDRETAIVRFGFAGKVDIRTFREENSYILDVFAADAKPEARDGAG